MMIVNNLHQYQIHLFNIGHTSHILSWLVYGPKLSTGYPQPVDFLCVDMWANFLLYDQLYKIPENVDKSI